MNLKERWKEAGQAAVDSAEALALAIGETVVAAYMKIKEKREARKAEKEKQQNPPQE